jgi:D-erythrulose 1-phosphate 3-epimerase
MINDPVVSLAIDNCFASKRWTAPKDWMSLIKDLGLSLVEASADTECDPLYMGEAYLEDWGNEVRQWSDKLGVRVANMYSGHGTYATLGLTHTDERVRYRFRDGWLKTYARTAKKLNAGMGFFAHAIPEPALQEPKDYELFLTILYEGLGELADFAAQIGLPSIGVEQMYTPHQPPWTVGGAKHLLAEVFHSSQAPFYLTLDLGHMNGQQYFQKPTRHQIIEWIHQKAAGKPCKRIWLGPQKAMEIFRRAVLGEISTSKAVEQIEQQWENYSYLFASSQDCSVHHWLQELGCYSPIIHLQQSDGKSSPHWPFSPEYNQKGIIRVEEVIHSIARAYQKEPQAGLPPPCSEIVLTFEPFISTAGNTNDALEEIEQSIQHWRQYIPRDGMRLSEVLKNCPQGTA